MKHLQDQAPAGTALVTGSSSGIGLAIARRLLADGHRVVGVSRRPGPIDEPGFEHLECDLANAEQTRAIFGSAVSRGPFRLLVHAAGLQRTGALGSLAPDASSRMWAVHVAAAEAMANTLVSHMPDGGRIVLVGSRTASGVPFKSQYSATKAALEAMARAWATELTPRRITVNVVAPGPTRTPMADDPARSAVPMATPPLGRQVEPDEVAGLVSFLVADSGAMITGQVLTIDGGQSLPPQPR